jgi:hypothetical protein
MNRLINRLLNEATVPIGEMSTRLFKKAMLFFLVMSCLFGSAIFLTIALFVFLQPLAGNAGAALSLGGLYLVAALICILVMRERPGRARQATAARTEDKEILPSQRAEFASHIDATVAPILDILQESGMERERLAIAASAEIAKQLHPFSLVAFAMVAGFILGHILRQGNHPRS